MDSWDSLTITEQTLMRRAVAGYPLGGMVQNYGLALRWAGAATAAAPRSLTGEEERALVPQLAAAAQNLADRGLLTVHEGASPTATAFVPVTGPGLHGVLTNPANWISGEGPRRYLSPTAPPYAS